MKYLLFMLLLFSFMFLAQDQDPLAVPDCPAGMRAVAKYHPQDYDGQDFEVAFEYGADLIDIGGMNWNDDQEVWMITWFVQPTNTHTPISAAFMKAGLTSDQLFIYDPPKTPQVPAEPILIQSDGKGISHITWCTPLEPTAIGLSGFTAVSGASMAAWLLLLGIALILAIITAWVIWEKIKR